MNNLRHTALKQIYNHQAAPKLPKSYTLSDTFGKDTLSHEDLKRLLPSSIYNRYRETSSKQDPLTREIVDSIAQVVLHWAIERRVTHYAHWFHPLTGATAEKHDALFDFQQRIEQLDGRELLQQEPDASSFPSGGIRSTFEARGYTVWDSSSPFFIWNGTLCIPTIFISYTSEALDEKVPLIKSQQALQQAALPVCQLFNPNVRTVTPMVGWEQEFFVVDRALYQARPDLMMAKRTLFGQLPARGQQLEDHYFGPITPRIINFLKAVEYQAHCIGIPLRTRHNEVAPAQYEFAPMFESANVATDHNQILRDVMEKVSIEHHLCVIFHEKPFLGFNGNGKHCNWSLATDQGVNLFDPVGESQEQFLLFFYSHSMRFSRMLSCCYLVFVLLVMI